MEKSPHTELLQDSLLKLVLRGECHANKESWLIDIMIFVADMHRQAFLPPK